MQIKAESLVKVYNGRRVVDGVSFHVNEGEVVGLLGPNGAGKTTSFYMIVGMIRANSGAIRIGDADVSHMPMYKRARLGVGYLPQETSVFRKLTVEQNILAILQTRKLSRAQCREEADRLMEEFKIAHLRKNRANTLSGGERRRLEIARALTTNPRFLLLDEPFAGIDPIAVIEIQRIIGFLKSRGIGVLITDHNVRETLGICDHAYIISEGRVLAQGTPAEIVNNADVRRVYLGEHFRM
jgi:lipopolysaccharide export system ATP-binding protein